MKQGGLSDRVFSLSSNHLQANQSPVSRTTMAENGNRPTLADVAKLAGVSLASASRVLNNTGPVSERMRERVEACAAQLGYEILAARAVARSTQQGLIAVLIADIRNPFFTEVLWGIEEEADDAGLNVLLFTTMEEPSRELRMLDNLRELSVDGVILSGSRLRQDELIQIQNKHNVPYVLLNRRIESPHMACILVNLERIAYRATQHLLTLDHTRIAYIAGPSSSESSLARQRGIERALQDAGLSMHPEWIVGSFPNIEGGFQGMSALLAQPPAERPTAVIAYNDMMALGALEAIRTHQLRVPQDISVVGFDDIAIAAHANPPLTTVAQPKYKMGKLAVRTLLQMQRRQMAPAEGYILLESPLIVRESTARRVSKS